MSKDRKGLLIGESDVITLYCQPGQRLCDLLLSFSTNEEPHIKSPISGDFENKNYTGRSPDPFSFHPSIKEEKKKRLWLYETTPQARKMCPWTHFLILASYLVLSL